MSDIVLLERNDGVAVLTFNDPERLNAMTEAMGQAIARTVAELAGDEAVRAVVLTGAGRAFSAGGDLDMIRRMADAGRADPGGPTREANRDFMGRFYRLYLAVRELPQPTLAAVNGHAIGAGCCVSLGCDVRIVAREAKLYTGKLVDGEEAARIGLANRCLPAADVLADALATARSIAAAAPLAVRGAKRSLTASPGNDLDAQLDVEAAEQARNYESNDLREGLDAVSAKRKPSFDGR
jgi:enoyl-CoA hydratase